MLVGRWRYSRS